MIDRAVIYRFYKQSWVPFVLGANLAFLALLLIAVLAALAGRYDPWVFIVLLLVDGVIVWLSLFATAYELELDSGHLTWRAPVRSGQTRLAEVRWIRNVLPSWPWPLVRIRFKNGGVFISATASLRSFVNSMVARNPGIDVESHSYESWRHDTWWTTG